MSSLRVFSLKRSICGVLVDFVCSALLLNCGSKDFCCIHIILVLTIKCICRMNSLCFRCLFLGHASGVFEEKWRMGKMVPQTLLEHSFYLRGISHPVPRYMCRYEANLKARDAAGKVDLSMYFATYADGKRVLARNVVNDVIFGELLHPRGNLCVCVCVYVCCKNGQVINLLLSKVSAVAAHYPLLNMFVHPMINCCFRFLLLLILGLRIQICSFVGCLSKATFRGNWLK
jgi:hypothetical protein